MILFVWVIFAIACGCIEAIFFHVADYGKLKEFNHLHSDIHIHLTLFRMVVFVLMCHSYIPREVLFMVLPCVLCFPLWHDGFYYIMRNRLNRKIYHRGFFSSPSINTTAMIQLSFKARVICFVIGLAAYIYLYHFSNHGS